MDIANSLKKLLLSLLETRFPGVKDIIVNIGEDDMIPYRVEYHIYIIIDYESLAKLDEKKLKDYTKNIAKHLIPNTPYHNIFVQTADYNS